MVSNYPNGFANGLSVRGLPVLNSYAGNVLWVDSVEGSDGNKGTFERPLATIDKALSLVTANNGDIIMLKPGHAENVADATTIAVDKAGVAIVGIGAGSLRPTLTFTNTAGSVEIDAANVTITNIRLLASVSAVVVGVNIDADNVTLNNIEFDFDATGDDFVRFVDCTGVEGTVIEGCQFRAENAAGSNSAIYFNTSNYTKIIGNYIFGDFATAAILSDTTTGTGSGVSEGIEIRGNTIYNSDTSIGAAIDINPATTGTITYNSLTGPTGITALSLLDPGSCMCIQNYAVNAVDESGTLVPATVST